MYGVAITGVLFLAFAFFAVAQAAAAASVRRIVYLGGLHPRTGDLSPHLRSRVAVGEVFLASGVPSKRVHESRLSNSTAS